MSYFEKCILDLGGQSWKTYRAKIDVKSDFYTRVKSQAEAKIHFSPNPSQSGQYRSMDKKYQNQLRGGIAEAYSKVLIEEFARFKNRDVEVERYDDVLTAGTGFTFDTIKGEYDIKVRVGGEVRLLESRSSVAHNLSIVDAIKRFDTIGRYTSFKKPTESFNDFYIRPLYEYVDFPRKDFYRHDFEQLLINGKVFLHFTGGADFKMMETRGYNKSMSQQGTNYRVIKILNGYTIDDFLDALTQE